MIRLALKLAFAAAALWAVWTFVPVRGRTLAERWHAAAGPADFLERGWSEAIGAPGAKPGQKPQAHQKAPGSARPTEAHTDADRRAVERILAERIDEKR
ncbi:MAG TPA: hypothetical protein VF912_00965 [Anaeromyxobacter sp.]